MPALKSSVPAQNAPLLDQAPVDTILHLASPKDAAVVSPVAALQADLASSLASRREPGRWPVGLSFLLLVVVGASMWWAIISGVLALLHR